MSDNTNTESRSILLWLRDTIPSIRGKIFSILDIPLDLETEHNEMVHTYLEHKSSLLPTQEELKQTIIYDYNYIPLLIYADGIYGNKNICRPCRGDVTDLLRRYDNVWCINTNYVINVSPYTLHCDDNGLYYTFQVSYVGSKLQHELKEVILCLDDILRFFKHKSLENNGWCKKHNPSYVPNMSIKYLNSVLDGMELYMKISYLLLCIASTITFKSANIEAVYNKANEYTYINNIHPCEDDYNKLYAIVIDYIHNIS